MLSADEKARGHTAVFALSRMLSEKVLVSHSAMSLAIDAVQEFNEMVRFLEIKGHDPSFF
jgi:hypothetical protein